MKTILDPTFPYVPSRETDIRKTFQRIRREYEEAARGPRDTVVPLKREGVAPVRDAAR
jgi:hypothetical protein